jgi:hypothetical protein
MNKVFVSLGGYGGCQIGCSCRAMGGLSLPFDWGCSFQPFIIKSIKEKFSNFSKVFESQRVNTNYSSPCGLFLLGHISGGETPEQSIEKYNRRCSRFMDILTLTDKEVIFIRDSRLRGLEPKDDVNLWLEFFNYIRDVYPVLNFKFLYLCSESGSQVEHTDTLSGPVDIQNTKQNHLEDLPSYFIFKSLPHENNHQYIIDILKTF